MLTPIRARDTIDLPFPPEAVWPVLIDARAYPEWWPPELRTRLIAPGDGVTGAELEIHPPSARPFRCRVEAVEPPRIRTRYLSDMLDGTGQWTVESLPAGCRVIYELDVVARGVLVAVLARFVDLAAIHSRGMQGVLSRLADRVARGSVQGAIRGA